MSALIFIILLSFTGTWLITDGIFSFCCYPNEKFRQQWVRIFRSILGGLLCYMAYIFGIEMFGG